MLIMDSMKGKYMIELASTAEKLGAEGKFVGHASKICQKSRCTRTGVR